MGCERREWGGLSDNALACSRASLQRLTSIQGVEEAERGGESGDAGPCQAPDTSASPKELSAACARARRPLISWRQAQLCKTTTQRP